jgi:hypothetical protein
MNTPKPDTSIPILTQMLATTASGLPAKKSSRSAVASAATEASASSSHSFPHQEPVAEHKFEGEWKALELKLNERVLSQILRRVDFVIEHRVKESLSDVLQAKTDELVKEIRRGLQVTLEDVIKRAVSQEIAKVQSVKE